MCSVLIIHWECQEEWYNESLKYFWYGYKNCIIHVIFHWLFYFNKGNTEITCSSWSYYICIAFALHTHSHIHACVSTEKMNQLTNLILCYYNNWNFFNLIFGQWRWPSTIHLIQQLGDNSIQTFTTPCIIPRVSQEKPVIWGTSLENYKFNIFILLHSWCFRKFSI
jgi:hypothetical protein